MKLAVLYSGGKDSNLAAYLAKEHGHEISCLISIVSKNKHSFMFHTPSIEKVKEQAKAMNVPLIIAPTEGEKEKELEDLKDAIEKAVEEHKVSGVVTGAVESVYQASRVQKICHELNLECFNPLWQKSQVEVLQDLVTLKFKVIVVGVFAYPLDQSYLGKIIDEDFIEQAKKLQEKYSISPSGEGGEFETFVLDSPLFEKELEVTSHKDFGEDNSWSREVEIK